MQTADSRLSPSREALASSPKEQPEVHMGYCPIELATDEKTLFELPPMSRMVPTTRTRITASITAYSAISWPCSSDQSLFINLAILPSICWCCGARLSCRDRTRLSIPSCIRRHEFMALGQRWSRKPFRINDDAACARVRQCYEGVSQLRQ
jgi:hypothetical protein